MLKIVKNRIKPVLLPLALLFLASCASKKTAYQTTVKQTATSLKRIYGESQRPWPSFDLTKHPILFVSFAEKTLHRFAGVQVQDLNFEDWKNKIPPTKVGFDTIEIDKQKYLVLHLDNYPELSSMKLLATALHEGFHYFGQDEWKNNKVLEGRGNIYPLQAIPRYYRWEMKQHLMAYFKTKNKKELRLFSYWHDRWKVNFKEESQSYTDRIEGTAQYYTNQMITIYNSQLNKRKVPAFEVFLQNTATNQPFRKMFSLSYESYVLGTLAGIILDEQVGSGWQKTVMLGPSPLELLARRYKPLHDEVDHKEQNEFVAASIREMKKVDTEGKLDQIISDLSNSLLVKVVIPSKGLQFTSFSTEGVYRSLFDFPGIKEVEMIGIASSHRIKGKDFTLEYQPGDYWVTSQQTPCGKEHATLLVFDKDQVMIEKNNFELKNGSLRLTGQAKTKHRTQWFCAQDVY